MRKILMAMVLFPVLVYAQDSTELIKQAKYNIIKAAVICYSNDMEGFPKFDAAVQLDCDDNAKDYNCLEKYCDKSNLLNPALVSNLVKNWASIPCTSIADLKKLRTSIINTIGIPRRAGELYFKEFQSGTQGEIDNLETRLSSRKPNPSAANNVSVDTQKKYTQDLTTDPLTDNNSQQKSSLPLIALIVSIVSLLVTAGAIVYYMMEKKKLATNHSEDRQNIIAWIDKKISAQNFETSQNKNSVATNSYEKRIKSLEKEMKFLRSELELLGSNVVTSNNDVTSRDLGQNKEPEAFEDSIIPIQPVALTVLYAKFPDLGDGTGFSQTVLLKDQNGEQIYEIEITGQRATYFVSSDPSAQKYAMNDPVHYLSKACIFLNQPQKGSLIFTEKAGVLTKSRDNWIIGEKAEIKFQDF